MAMSLSSGCIVTNACLDSGSAFQTHSPQLTTAKRADSKDLSIALARVRANESEMRLRWIKDEDNWRKLPPRAWPEKQPNQEDIPAIQSEISINCKYNLDSADCVQSRFELATALVFNGVDVDEGFSIYRNLAKAGFSDGMTAMGVCLLEGIGININAEEGLKWIQKSAELGNAQAMYELAILYYTGSISPLIPEDEKTAYELFQKASEQEHTCALYMVAYVLLHGQGCETDTARAVDLLYRAGERGHRSARRKLLALLEDHN